MVGITLSPEQIHSAPPEVRQWLEHEIARTLGLRPASSAMEPDAGHLAACTPQEATTIYASISGMLPVVNVFFELGREGASVGQDGLEAFRLVDMVRHTRLPGLQQLAACLQVIDETFRQVRNDEDAALFVLDQRGYCIVAAATQQSILGVWRHEIASQQLVAGEAAEQGGRDAIPARPSPFSTSGTLSPASVHLGATPLVQADADATLGAGGR